MTTTMADAWKARSSSSSSSRRVTIAPPGRRRLGNPGSRRLRGVYDGTETNRATADWTPGEHEPIALTANWLSLLRQRSRSLARTAPHVVSAFTAIKDNVVGADGFRLRPQPVARGSMDPDEIDPRLQRQLAQLWREHASGIDIDRRESFATMLRTGLGEYPEAGEVFVVESQAPQDDAGVVPQVIELVPAERLDHGLHSSLTSVKNVIEGNRVTNGIEFDPEGRRVAYHFAELDRYGLATYSTLRVPARRVHHLYHRQRAGQERGLPWLYASTILAHDLDDLIDTELTSAQVAACLSAFVKTEAGTAPFNDDPDTERDADDERPIVRFEPGMVGYLNEGESVDIADPQRPGNNFDPFASFLIRMLGKSLGPAYETVSGDYRRVNFASGRLAHLVERKAFRRIQADTRDLVVRPVYRSFVRSAILAGKVQIRPADYMADPRRFDRVDIQAPGWEHADPLKEATAAALRILIGISTLDEEAAALGRDWRTIIDQRAREVSAMESAGLPLFTVGGAQAIQGMSSANSTARLKRLATKAGFDNEVELVSMLEDGALETWARNGNRLNGHQGASI